MPTESRCCAPAACRACPVWCPATGRCVAPLIVFYADNRITIEGGTRLAFTEDRPARFAAYGWHVQRVEDGNDIAAVTSAIGAAREEKERPSFIDVGTHIGFGSPHKHDTASAHGEPLGEEEVRLAKERLGWPTAPPFFIPPQAQGAIPRGRETGNRVSGQLGVSVPGLWCGTPSTGRRVPTGPPATALRRLGQRPPRPSRQTRAPWRPGSLPARCSTPSPLTCPN